MMLTKIKFIPKIMKSMSHSLFETKEYGNSDMTPIVNAVKNIGPPNITRMFTLKH